MLDPMKAAPRRCACGELVPRGRRCQACAKRTEQRRGTASERGYNQPWVRFRPVYMSLLVAAGVVPACGATLANGPKTNDSHCRILGRLTFQSADGSSLHLDHDPELEDWERSNADRVCDPRRIQLLCASCHSRKAEKRGVRNSPTGGYSSVS